jgi:ATP-dependent protease ClpP protease subunit
MENKQEEDNLENLYEYNIDTKNRTLYLNSDTHEIMPGENGLGPKSFDIFIKGFNLLDSTEGDITIIMSGLGGDHFAAMAIYDAIKSGNNKVIMKCYGAIMSANSIILQAANTRLISKFTKIMIHYGTFNIDDHTKVVKNWAKESEKLDKELEDVYLSRIRSKNKNFTRKQLKEMLNFDTILDSQQSIKLGLADKII